MQLIVNDEKVTTGAEDVAGLLRERLGEVPAGTAVALNGDVVPKSEWEKTQLTDGATVDILTAVQGG
ncbi:MULTISPECIES: sulfur carrier protein ThiS [unclassified Corynebacterium]|uniref:sulfur carrier protein ThiS n=1 Tax=unclassified Corynebacterium TaxID=2624378 RepID=UPI0021A9E533|nr:MULTISPECIES: sulfur carrier protein ThiS [unclassified Corynebacterium]MCT1453259.1 sulfur carrier protein ThiS [Corynebacterium sp. p3-SID1145]MCT1462345.1 sulfur carrier protein ThiS [Corynebacterium sp. p3-SID1140]MDN8595449.1 sulfur carrier protein ThiS [Corynebacterium sp. P4_F2]WKK56579.1 sulfur carrier protein ThiS [Corynebacterium sp. P4-C1]WKK64015.1 sulfur carrier protein ThiS [Corynebacterium sp. P8-C1]